MRAIWRVLLCCLLGAPASGLAAGACDGVAPPPAIGPSRGDVPFGQGLLWEVRPPGGTPSYLFGTMHVSDEEVVRLPPSVDAAFERTGAFVMEVLMEPDAVMAFAARMFFTDGTSLRSLTGDPLFERAAAVLARHRIAPVVAERIRPWAAFLTLSMPPEDGGRALDVVLYERAKSAGRPVYGLETMQEQGDALAMLDQDDQVALLRDVVCHYDLVQREIGVLKRHYLAGNLAAMLGMAGRYAGNAAHYRKFVDRLIWSRNERMARRMQPYLRRGGAFVAVGALHLPGERGILRRLETAGYRVSRVR